MPAPYDELRGAGVLEEPAKAAIRDAVDKAKKEGRLLQVAEHLVPLTEVVEPTAKDVDRKVRHSEGAVTESVRCSETTEGDGVKKLRAKQRILCLGQWANERP